MTKAIDTDILDPQVVLIDACRRTATSAQPCTGKRAEVIGVSVVGPTG